MITKVVKGCPKELIEKRKNRIQEALDIKFDNPCQPVKFVVDTLPDGNEVSRKKIPPPQVKYPHQELAVLLCREGIFRRAFLTERIEAWDELEVRKSLPA